MRFGRGIRSLGAVLFIVGMVLWLPVAIYVPAITFNQVTGIGIHVITPIVCIICTFYTCLGGLKAVIWTDVIQSFVMYGSILAVCIKGTIDVGGIDVVWQRNADGGRLNAPAYTWDPTVRLSMASVLIGGTLHKIQSSAVNQISIQRYLSLPSYKKARQAMFLFTILLTFLLLCCAYVGLVSFATFYDCDPLTTKLARASDQLPSLLMMIVLGSYPGLPGLFVAGVFSAALSSLSTGLNSLACVISQDIINPFIKRKLSERNTAIILRLIVIFFGLGCIGLVVVVEKLGMVLELSSMTGAVTMGPLLGVYTMGVCLPWINGKYFERRFDRRIRIFGSLLFVASATLWMPIGIYVPALTFNQVSGINVHVIVPVVCIICTAYTTIGGIKGVVWTDVIQGIVMVGSMLLVIIKGTIDVGGLGVIWDRNMASDRLVAPDMTFDPTVRMGVFAVFIGGAAFKLQANCINQSIVQRFLTLPDMKSVKKSLIFSMLGFLFVMAMCVYIGLLAFAEYYDCDPITTGLARAKDQVIPLYVMQSASVYPGVVGLFVAGVFSAALSTLSTVLNSLSAVVLKDFVEVFRSKPLTERQTAYIMRGVVIFFGLISMLGVHLVQHLGMVMQLSASVAAITCGPLLGAFTVGMLLPFVNTRSLLAGISVASAFTSYIVVRAQVALATGDMTFPTKPVSVEGCTYDFELPANSTMHEEPTSKSLHHISFLWYTFIGSAGTILCSLIATLYFGKQDPQNVAPELLAECVRSYWHPNYSKVATEEIHDKFRVELIDDNCKVNGCKPDQVNGDN